MSEPLPKGQMRQPEVHSKVKPDQPNAARHAALKAMWRRGQRWETLVEGCTTWVPVSDGGRAEPLWDAHQEYRRLKHHCPHCDKAEGSVHGEFCRSHGSVVGTE